VLAAAIVIAALCFPGAVLLWRLGELWLQTEFLAYRKEKHRESAEATAKQAHEIQAAVVARVAGLELSLGEALAKLSALESLKIAETLRDLKNDSGLKSMAGGKR
jgi:hypothetical protein